MFFSICSDVFTKNPWLQNILQWWKLSRSDRYIEAKDWKVLLSYYVNKFHMFLRYKSKIALLFAVNIAINLLIDRCLRTMTMVGRWTGGGLALWCTRWCVADYHSIIVIMTFCLNLSCFNKSNFLGLCRRTLPLSYQACWSRTPNKGLS